MFSKLFADYAVRMESLAPSLLLYSRIKAARKYSEYDLLLLIMGVILYIYEGMMESAYRTPEEITEQLRDLVRQTYRVFLSDSEATDFANYLLYDLLQKDGAEAPFTYTSPEDGREKTVAVQIIAMHTFTADGKVTYKLSSQGLRFLYSTKEFEQEIEITIQLFYIRQHIKNRKYEPALKGVQDTILLLQSVVAQFDEFEARCRADALSIAPGELDKLKARALSNFYEEKEQFERLTEMVREGLAEIEKEGLAIAKVDERARQQLRSIETKLRQATQMHQTLLNRKTRAEMAYHQAVQNRIARGVLKQINFAKDVLDPLLEANATLAQARLGLHFLFFHPRKQLNPIMKALSPQNLRSEPSIRNEVVLLDEEIDRSAHERRRAIMERQTERYQQYLVGFFTLLQEARQVKTSEYLAQLPPKLATDAASDPFLAAFLLDFHQAGIMNIQTVEREAKDYLRVEEEGVDLLWLLLECQRSYPQLFDRQYLVVTSGPAGAVVELNGMLLSDFCMYLTDDLEEVEFHD